MNKEKMQESAELYYAINWDELSQFEQANWTAAWNASRAAIVIELPCELTECVDGEFIYLDLASEAIESKGLKWVKQ